MMGAKLRAAVDDARELKDGTLSRGEEIQKEDERVSEEATSSAAGKTGLGEAR
jgi:hypothetical protein